MTIKDMNLKKFKIGDLFEVEGSKGTIHANMVTIYDIPNSELHPYVVRSSKNNGVRGYINFDKAMLNCGNVITFAMDTFVAFYQEANFFTGNKVKILKHKFGELNKLLALFYCTIINKTFKTWVWGNLCSVKTLKEVEIPVPVNESGEIDFELIESYMKDAGMKAAQRFAQRETDYIKSYEIESKRKSEKYKEIVISDTGSEEYDDSLSISNMNLKKFKLSELFEISGTKSLNENQIELFDSNESGNLVEFVGRTSKNNGVKGFIERLDFPPNPAWNISISQIGTICAKFRESEWYASQNMIKLTSIVEVSRLLMLYYLSVINNLLSTKYSKGYHNYPTLNKLKDDEIPVPINESGEIDFELIESYMKTIAHRAYKRFVQREKDYIENYKKESELKIQKYEQIVNKFIKT